MSKQMSTIGLLLCLWWPVSYLSAQTVADPDFRYKVSNPRYEQGKGPIVLYDEGHYNAFGLKGQYAGFARVLEADGYRTAVHTGPITPQALSHADIFVTVNALYDPMNWDLPASNVFTEQEVEWLHDWVYRDGGSLFIISDHMPSAGAFSSLAARFGFNLINGFAERKDGQADIFSRERGNLTANPVTDASGFEIDSIRAWGVAGFIPPAEAIVLTTLGKDYELFLPSRVVEMSHPRSSKIPKISRMGLANGAILPYGRGRICVFADAAVFAALLQGVKSNQRGMNHPDASQNAPFLLNIIRWLSQHD